MAQQRADVSVPPGVGAPAQDYSSSGQAGGGGSGSVFGDLGGPGQQQGGGVIGGQEIPPAPRGTDPGGQGGR